MRVNIWEQFYRSTPIDKIPWQKTQADWLGDLANKKEISGDSALDLGCGTGMKSIFLVKDANFTNIVGVDISETAIKHANDNAKKAGLTKKVKFYTHFATDLSFLNDQKFDLIVDWALFHCLNPKDVSKYIEQIIEHSKPNSKFLLRVFAKGKDKSFETKLADSTTTLFLYSDKMIKDLFASYFKILKKNRSVANNKTNPPFNEYLMERSIK